MRIYGRLAALALVLVLVLAAASPAEAAWGGRYSVCTRGSFSGQVTNYSCVGASIQMMLSMIGGGRDKSATRQMKYWRYARDHSRYHPTNKGADPRGWAVALRHFGAGEYRDVAHPQCRRRCGWRRRGCAPRVSRWACS